MSSTSSLRRAAGLLAGCGVLTVALLAGEIAWVTTREYLPASAAPNTDGRVVTGSGPLLRLAVLGDSTAAGVGASNFEATVGGRLAAGLAERRTAPVEVFSVAISGSRTADLGPQVSRALLRKPHLAVILIGANDATAVTDLDDLSADLRRAVTRLRDAGVPVVLGSCPDMGGARALPHPLRDVVAWRGRSVADAQHEAVDGAGTTVVDLARETGPAFRADPRTVSSDRYHPSDRGYALWADALLPAVGRLAADVTP
ncbi:MAG: SGNH/GDSL hydrolase family protein [Actinomycetota bacterium]|nr:SGNH/GDSL hydrolase family protein [Actinomycetota bacterium]